MRLGSNRKTVAGKKSDVLRQLKDKNVTIFSEISQNVTLASTFCHSIPIELIVILLV